MSHSVLMIVPDLFFATRIREVAAATGVVLHDATAATAVQAITTHAPGLAIVDLQGSAEPGTLVRTLREADARLRIVGFFPHVDEALRTAALEAGADQVLPRSAFTRRLPELLAGG